MHGGYFQRDFNFHLVFIAGWLIVNLVIEWRDPTVFEHFVVLW